MSSFNLNKVVIGILFLFVLQLSFVSAIDDLFSLQGNVLESGANLASGNLTVYIFDAGSGGNVVWNSSLDNNLIFNNSISSGKYDVLLGNDSSNELSLNYGQLYYIEMFVNDEVFTFNGSARQVFQSSVGQVNRTFFNGNLSISQIDGYENLVFTNDSAVFDNDFNITLGVNGWFNGLFNWTLTTAGELYLTFTGGVLDFDEAQLNATIDDRLIANETNRFSNLTAYDCQGTDKVISIALNGTIECGSDADTVSDLDLADFQASFDLNKTNIFDQDLNTTSNVRFANITSVGNFTISGDAVFGGGWQSGGVSIMGGNVFVQTLFAVNITSLGVSNLAINASLLPPLGFSGNFDVGNESLQWRNGFFSNNLNVSNEVYINGVEVSTWLYNQSDGANETVFVSNLTSYDCQGTDKVVSIANNGTVVCGSDVDTTVGSSWTFAPSLIYNDTSTLRFGVANVTPVIWTMQVDGNVSLNKTLFVNTNGLVGIGTDSPDKLLDVENTNVTLRLTDAKSGSWDADERMAGIEFFTSDGSSNGPMVIGNIEMRIHTGRQGSTPRADMVFGVGDPATDLGAVEVFRITEENKYMGIGTDSPDKLLDVSGENSEVIFQDETGNEVALIFQSVEASFIFDIITQKSTSNTAARTLRFHQGTTESLSLGTSIIRFNNDQADMDFVVEAVGTDNALFVQGSNGFVGIGTSTPGSTFTVMGSGNFSGQVFDIGNNRDTISVDTNLRFGNAEQIIWDASGGAETGEFSFSDAVNILGNLYIAEGGSLGTPSDTDLLTLSSNNLDIQGGFTVDDDSSIGRGNIANIRLAIQETNTQTTDMLRLIQAGTGDVLMAFVKSSGVDWIIGEDASDNGNFKISEGLTISSNTRFVIENSTGFIGIGATNPSSLLEVEGTLVGGNITLSNSDTSIVDGQLLGALRWKTYDIGGDFVGGIRMYAAGDYVDEGGGASPSYMSFFTTIAGTSTDPHEVMRINEWGMVGINVVDGDLIDRLTVQGGLRVFNASACIGDEDGCTPSTGKGNLLLEGVLNAGDTDLQTYNSFGDANGGSDDAAIADQDDVYISDDLEVDGTFYLTGGSGAIVNSDIAENLLTKKGREAIFCEGNPSCVVENFEKELDFGDVVCINPNYGQTITKCTEPNSRFVAGVISNTTVMFMGNNGMYGNPVAVAGIVWTHVSIENGEIFPGDLLVSASKPGYAMKNNNPRYGTVLGKAYDSCTIAKANKNGECDILMFVALG